MLKHFINFVYVFFVFKQVIERNPPKTFTILLRVFCQRHGKEHIIPGLFREHGEIDAKVDDIGVYFKLGAN